jgi:hypothetical protein
VRADIGHFAGDDAVTCDDVVPGAALSGAGLADATAEYGRAEHGPAHEFVS